MTGTNCICGETIHGLCRICGSHAPPTAAERREQTAAAMHRIAVENMITDTMNRR